MSEITTNVWGYRDSRDDVDYLLSIDDTHCILENITRGEVANFSFEAAHRLVALILENCPKETPGEEE